jgi:hypothetical protein
VLPRLQPAGSPQSLPQQRQQLEELWKSLQHFQSQPPPQQQQQQRHGYVAAHTSSQSNATTSSCDRANILGDSDASSSSSGLPRCLVDSGVLSVQQSAQLQQWSVEYAPLLQGVVSAPLIAGFAAIAIGSYPPLRVSVYTVCKEAFRMYGVRTYGKAALQPSSCRQTNLCAAVVDFAPEGGDLQAVHAGSAFLSEWHVVLPSLCMPASGSACQPQAVHASLRQCMPGNAGQ